MIATWYEARGSVRGACGHKHRTLSAAAACVTRDANLCAALPGGNSYSDRTVVRLDGEPLTHAELDALGEVRS